MVTSTAALFQCPERKNLWKVEEKKEEETTRFGFKPVYTPL